MITAGPIVANETHITDTGVERRSGIGREEGGCTSLAWQSHPAPTSAKDRYIVAVAMHSCDLKTSLATEETFIGVLSVEVISPTKVLCISAARL